MTLIVWVTAWREPDELLRLSGELERVGASAYRLVTADDSPPAPPAPDAPGAPRAQDSLGSLGGLPHADTLGLTEVVLGDAPVTELAAWLADHDPATLAVGGRQVSALLAGLAAGTQLRVGSVDTPGDGSVRHEVQLVARAVALSRLAGRQI